MGRLAFHVATERLTAIWQLSCLPVCPQRCRATPTEWVPFPGRPVSSTIQATTGPLFVITAKAESRVQPSGTSSLQAALAATWCSDWCIRWTLPGASRAAVGSTDLRSSGRSRPVQYSLGGITRSSCLAASVRRSKKLVSRCCRAPGVSRLGAHANKLQPYLQTRKHSQRDINFIIQLYY
jgi:hypothetical protein